MRRFAVAGLLFAGSMLAAASAFADGMDVKRHVHRWHGYDLRLPPERHVIEVVDGWGRFIINGTRFTPADPRCATWTAGDRIAFLSGELHGYCVTATIHNISRRQTCEVACGSAVVWF